MGVDVSELVLVALGDTNDHVVDQSADSAEGSDILARAVVQLNVDALWLWVGESDSQVTKVLDELATRSLNGDLAGLDVDLDCGRSVSFVCSSFLIYDFCLCQCYFSAARESRVVVTTYHPLGCPESPESRCNAS